MSRPVDNALLYGFFGSNFGDLAVTQGALTLLRQAGVEGPIRIVTPPLAAAHARAGWRATQTAFPEVEAHQWDVKLAALRHDGPPTLELVDDLLASTELRRALVAAAGLTGVRRLFYGGGEHLFGYGDADGDWNLLGRGLPLLAALREGARLYVLPSTFGPFESAFARALVARLLDSADLVLSRDLRSASVATGVDARLRPALDPAFFLQPTSKGRPYLRTRPLSVGLVMRQEGAGLRVGAAGSRAWAARVRSRGPETSRAFRFFSRMGADLLVEGRELRVLVQCLADREGAEALTEKLRATHPEHAERVALVEARNLAQYYREIGRCDVVATTRFHAAIFALTVGTAAVGLYFPEHGHKMPGLFDMFGRPDLCFDASVTPPVRVGKRLGLALRREPRLGRNLQAETERLRGETLDLLRAALQG